MKTFIFAVFFVLIAGIVGAACTTNIINGSDGSVQTCTTCCYGNHCTTNCY